MKTNVNMDKCQFGVYDITLGEWLDKSEFKKMCSGYGWLDLLNACFDNIIIPTDHVLRDVVEVLLEEAYNAGLRDCNAYGAEVAENIALQNVGEWLHDKALNADIDVRDMEALQEELKSVVTGEYLKDLTLEEGEKLMIQRALEKCSGNKRAAARRLGVSERTIFRKVLQYGLE